MTFIRLIAATLAACLFALPAAAFDTKAHAAWVYDLSTKTVLMAKNADIPLPPASMSKLMTLDLLFEALEDGRVTMDTTFPVSEHAQSMGGSTMFLNTTDRPTVRDLIQGIIINSGNDACVVVAEGLAGSESSFADLMTKRAHELGMKNSMFANSNGWPDPGQRMSVHDLGIVASRIITHFPQYYHFFSETHFNYKDRAPANAENRNPLLDIRAADWKADGMKTGHTQEAGYGLVGSAVMGERRIVFVLAGMDSEQARRSEGEAVANWAFRQFVMKDVAKAGTKLAEAPVWLGGKSTVGLAPKTDLSLLIPAGAKDKVSAEAVFKGPLQAPIKQGQEVGKLVITVPGLDNANEIPLVATEDVKKGGFVVRVKAALARLSGKAFEAAMERVNS
ncbi:MULTISPECIES: D-alanyl-D-alanine carboxypeptidase family protein [Thioclava]|uniref:D-alanyl-D-alanine carboxypeptidase family protein n=1 Tax=Thioclava TaxID=285107 RepID=UPI000989E71F|nr:MULTISPECIES: D-alanyl-D-alanine carboxypeptidase family protein [Thioclava]OWX99356.1 D-alanyl-D-alanine carboxypeptidase [Thioclava sp. IC9]OWY01713.1 D-alanyl-D-alanine carboxypeptidase [Thioclava sp. F1Mire-8]OWY10022.1 D-alanyl-D-alanine carboxypeptidase [Thioclava sp. F42-5]OWY12327.1 D-alanyl-D-alanine carboxypeptidase [Thioclava sp. F34-6]OWY17312.1 D-alanyl-D-alanine carboxypeptidase [Thioclava sp. JM3]